MGTGLAGALFGAMFHGTVKSSGVLNINELVEMFSLPNWDKIDDANIDYYFQESKGAGDEEAQEKAEGEARDELFRRWHDAVMFVADHEFEEHGLELRPTRQDRTPYEYRVVAAKSWADAAEKIRQTVNGVGYFSFASLKGFLSSGPYTPRQAVLGHLHWMRRRAEVYGDTSPRRTFERQFR